VDRARGCELVESMFVCTLLVVIRRAKRGRWRIVDSCEIVQTCKCAANNKLSCIILSIIVIVVRPPGARQAQRGSEKNTRVNIPILETYRAFLGNPSEPFYGNLR
jgi:hypothetical protein